MTENHIPPEIHQLARTHHLGEPTARYETLPSIIRQYHFSLYTIIIVIWLGLFALLSTILLFVNTFAIEREFGIRNLSWYDRAKKNTYAYPKAGSNHEYT